MWFSSILGRIWQLIQALIGFGIIVNAVKGLGLLSGIHADLPSLIQSILDGVEWLGEAMISNILLLILGAILLVSAFAAPYLVSSARAKWKVIGGREVGALARSANAAQQEYSSSSPTADFGDGVGLLHKDSKEISLLMEFVSDPLYELHRWLMGVFNEIYNKHHKDDDPVFFFAQEAVEARIQKEWESLDNVSKIRFYGNIGHAKIEILFYCGAQVKGYKYLIELVHPRGDVLSNFDSYREWREKAVDVASKARGLSHIEELRFMREIGDLIDESPPYRTVF